MEVRSQIMFNIFSGETVDELYIAVPNQVCSFEVVPLILCLLPAQSSLSILNLRRIPACLASFGRVYL